MKSLPVVVMGEEFASLHEQFEVNTPLIAECLGRIGLRGEEISDFRIHFEDDYEIPFAERFLRGFGTVQYPSLGWTHRTENAIHITALNGGLLTHPTVGAYGHSVLHQLGHLDHMRKMRPMRQRRQERLAERFVSTNALLINQIVDYSVNDRRAEQLKLKINAQRIEFQDKKNIQIINATDKVLRKLKVQ